MRASCGTVWYRQIPIAIIFKFNVLDVFFKHANERTLNCDNICLKIVVLPIKTSHKFKIKEWWNYNVAILS